MPLKLTIKPGEHVYMGPSKVTTLTDQVIVLLIDGPIPVMRDKDYLLDELATTDARQLYLLIQTSYLAGSPNLDKDEFGRIVSACLVNDPGSRGWLTEIEGHVAKGELYKALKPARQLVQFSEGQIIPGEKSSEWQGFTALS